MLLRLRSLLTVIAQPCQGLLYSLLELPLGLVKSMFLSLHVRLFPANGLLKCTHGSHEGFNHGANILSVTLQTFMLLTQLSIDLLTHHNLRLLLSCNEINTS